jgi:Protein of unknown function (DUF2514)
MSLLLNWRIWLLVFLALGEVAFGWKMYKMGGNSVQVEFDMYKNQQVLDTLAAEKAARVKEQSLQVANRKVSENYESLKTATATAVGALDAERMRLQAALAASSASGDTSAVTRTDGTAKDYIFSRCLERYEAVARDAAAVADKAVGLQDYIKNVVPK